MVFVVKNAGVDQFDVFAALTPALHVDNWMEVVATIWSKKLLYQFFAHSHLVFFADGVKKIRDDKSKRHW